MALWVARALVSSRRCWTSGCSLRHSTDTPIFLLDTHVISELRQGNPRQSEAVRRWAAGQASHQLFLSAITLLALELGIQALEQKLTVVTRNVSDFETTGVLLVNPWAGS